MTGANQEDLELQFGPFLNKRCLKYVKAVRQNAKKRNLEAAPTRIMSSGLTAKQNTTTSTANYPERGAKGCENDNPTAIFNLKAVKFYLTYLKQKLIFLHYFIKATIWNQTQTPGMLDEPSFRRFRRL